jgi:succinate-acetate transporter protein
MDHPQIIVNLNRIHHPESIATKPQGNLENTSPIPIIGFAMSALLLVGHHASSTTFVSKR